MDDMQLPEESHRCQNNNRPLNLAGTQFSSTNFSSGAIDIGIAVERNCDGSPRPASPTLSISTLSSLTSSVVAINNVGISHPTSVTSSDPRPAKRRKLTTAERTAKQQETEAEQKRRDERRAQKAEEKRQRDEEKQRKAEDREHKKRLKELEDQRRLEEKQQKERSQMKLGTFFQTKLPLKDTVSSTPEMLSTALNKTEVNLVADVAMPRTSNTHLTDQQHNCEQSSDHKTSYMSEYRRFFLPYVAPAHTYVARTQQSQHDTVTTRGMQAILDEARDTYECHGSSTVYRSSSPRDVGFGVLFPVLPGQSRGSIMGDLKLLGKEEDVSLQTEPEVPRQAGGHPSVTYRHLQFYEDVRPPYRGTYTKIRNSAMRYTFSRRPFHRFRVEANYDHDSEADYEEPDDDGAESEGLSGEDEDDAESVDNADEMHEFLEDDEAAYNPRRTMMTGDLQPWSTGICWTSRKRDQRMSDLDDVDSQAHSAVLSVMSLRSLLSSVPSSGIDPFSTAYWQPSMPPPITLPVETVGSKATVHRMPLKERSPNANGQQTLLGGVALCEKAQDMYQHSDQSIKRAKKASSNSISPEDFSNFKAAVSGSPLPKIDLLKGLKQRFPGLTNDTIKHTLNSCFAQHGGRKTKIWVYIDTSAALQSAQSNAALGVE